MIYLLNYYEKVNKLVLYLIKNHAMKACWGIEAYFHLFLTSALDGVIGQFHNSGRFTSSTITPVTVEYGAGWAQSRSGHFGEARNLTEPNLSVVQDVTGRHTDGWKFVVRM
jgi:hypothetical protein